MADSPQTATQRDLPIGIAAELAAAGFGDAEEIGHGGYGVVYRCYEYSLERHVAVKVLMSEVCGDERAQFVREQQALGRLSGHPHILQVLQVDVTATGRPYIVAPYHARGSLERLVRDSGPLRWPEVVSIGVKIAGALAAAHAITIVHRDVKPGNVLLTDYGEPQLADFGIAQFGNPTTSSVRTIQGTPAFTAPEVLSGAAPAPASDIYGLGATLFYLLAGYPAFGRQNGEPLEAQLARIATAPIPDLREHAIPDAVCTALETAMATAPADRPASAIDFGELLRDIQRHCGQPVDMMATPPGTGDLGSATAVALPPHSPGAVTPPAPPIPATKFRPPSPPRSLLERTRLLGILRQGGQRRLTLIHGPAGFGTTSLAMQWGQLLESEGVSLAWLTADPDDDNVSWFLAHLVEAIRRARPELARELTAFLEERSSDTVRYVLSALINEIHDSARPMAVVIDDWHRVTSSATIAALEYLLEHGCHHLRVVVASRARTGLPLTRMQVHDELVEIDATALRFDAAETHTFLVDINQLTLTAADVARLRDLTEGWPAALQLVSLSLRGRDDPGPFIDKLTGRHHVIGEYLTENVLDSLEQPVLEFLLDTATAGQVCADLANALSERTDSQDLLEEIADRNLFLLRMDEDGEWFRYHRLFADYLQRRLQCCDPDRLMELHQRAATWFADHGMLSDAIDQAISAGDPQRAVDLVEVRAVELIEHSRTATFLGLMAKLPTAYAESRPRLQLCVAWANVGLQRREPVRTALRNVSAALDNLGDDEATTLRIEAATVRGVEDYVNDCFNGLSDVVAAHLEDAGTPFLAVAVANQAAIDALNRFDFAAARSWHEVTVRRGRHRGPFVLMHSFCVAGLAALEQIDIAAAEGYFEAAIAVSLRAGAPTHSSTLAGALLGGLRYEQGRLGEAEQLLGASARLGQQGGPVDFLLATYGTSARIAALQGDLAVARERLDSAAKLAEDATLPRLGARIVNERIRLGLPIPEGIRTRLTDMPLYRKQDTRIHAGIAEVEQDSAIRLLLAQNSAAAADDACRRAAQLAAVIATQERPLALARAQLLDACCRYAAGCFGEAETAASQALSQCAEHSLPRLVADAGPQMTDIAAARR